MALKTISSHTHAATSIVTGLITGDITGGLAGASAPYLAEQIKLATGHKDPKTGEWKTDDKAANLTAHALLGAAVAIAQGNSALAGGAGALAGEAAADFIREKLYNKDVKDLSEAEKENISALAQLAVGHAVAAGTGGNTNDIGTAVAGSKNAVENNNLAATVPIIQQSLASLLGVQNPNQVNNDQLALSIEKSLKGLGVTISDTYDNLTSEQKVTYLGELVQELSDEDKAKVQYQYKIDTERNQIAMGNRPKVDSFNDYLATNEYGKGLSDKLTQIGVDAKGNPIYQATGSGYGNYIWGESYVTMDSRKDTLLVYGKDGSFQAALNLDGTINETLTGISKGGSLPTIVDKPIQNHTGGNQIQDPLPPLPGFIPQESLVPNNTGHGDGLDNIEIKHDTGGNQLPEIFVPNTGGEQIIEKDWQDNVLTADNRLPIPERITAGNGLDIESNTKHTPGAPGFRPNAGTEPRDSLDIFEGSISIGGNKHRYAIDSEGNIHRYSPSNTGAYHWTGSTGDKKNPLELDNKTKSNLRKQEGWKIK